MDIEQQLQEFYAKDFESMVGRKVLFTNTHGFLPLIVYCTRILSVSPNRKYVELKPLDMEDDIPYWREITTIRIVDVID